MKKKSIVLIVMCMICSLFLFEMPVNAVEGNEQSTSQSEVKLDEYITHASLKQLVNGTWIDVDPTDNKVELTDGTPVQFSLDYTITQGVITSHDQIVTYQLDANVSIPKEMTGFVTDNGRNVGTYVITTDGKITIQYNADYISSEANALSGNVTFTGSVQKENDNQENEDIQIGDLNIQVIPSSDEFDIAINKSSQLDETDKTKIHYTLEVSSNKGTREEISVTDTINSSLASTDINTIKVLDTNGKEVPKDTYTITQNGSSFKITGLPKLDANQKYTITYDAIVDESKVTGNGQDYVNNQVTAESGGNTGYDQNQQPVGTKRVDKYGELNGDSIKWTVKVNGEVAGKTITEHLPEGLEWNGSANLSNGQSITFTKQEDGTYTYTFPTDTPNGEYAITFETPISQDKLNGTSSTWFNNTVDFDGYEASGGVTYNPTQPIQKSFDSYVNSTKNGIDYYWNVTLNIPKQNQTNYIYTDTLSTKDNNNSTTTEIYHYIKDLELTVTDENNNTIDSSNYTILYYDASGNSYSSIAEAGDTKLVKFTIQFTDTYINSHLNGKIKMHYKTYADFTAMENGETYKYVNTGVINDYTVPVEHSHEKKEALEKYVGTSSNNKITITKSGESGVSKSEERYEATYSNTPRRLTYDETNGKLYYMVLIRPEDYSNITDYTVVDTLPAGTSLCTEELYAPYLGLYQNKYYQGLGDNNQYEGKFLNDEFSYTYDEDTNEVTFKLSKFHFDLLQNYNNNVQLQDLQRSLAICYVLNIDNPEKLSDVVAFDNKVEWNNYEDSQRQEVKFDSSLLNKTSTYNEDNHIIFYRLTVNPAEIDMLENFDTVKIHDQLSYNTEDADILIFVPTSLKVYKYDASKEDHKGVEVDYSEYKYTYDNKTHEIIVEIPDAFACIIEYQYYVETSKNDGISLSNKAWIEGLSDTQTDNDIHVEYQDSSATVEQDIAVRVYKVDAESYKTHLDGAVFALDQYLDGKWESKGNFITENNENPYYDGSFVITLKHKGSETYDYPPDTVLRLTETKAPDGYEKNDKPTYFLWTEETGSDEAYWQEHSNILPSGVNTEDVQIIRKGGAIIIPNQYTNITVTKSWLDKDGVATDNHPDSAQFQLYQVNAEYKDVYEDEYYTVHLYGTNGTETKDYGEYKIQAGGSFTLKSNNTWKTWMDVTDNDTSITDYKSGLIIVNNIDANHNITFIEQAGQYVQPTLDQYAWQLDDKGTDIVEPMQKLVYDESEATPIGEPITLTKDTNWKYTWTNLSIEEGKYYFVKEVNVPEGWDVTYTNNLLQKGEITVINQSKNESVVLPETGGIGKQPYIWISLTMICIGGLYFYVRKRKRQ